MFSDTRCQRATRVKQRRTPSHTGTVRRDAVARAQLAGREVRVSGRAASMVAVAQFARAHAAVAHGDCARDPCGSDKGCPRAAARSAERLSFANAVDVEPASSGGSGLNRKWLKLRQQSVLFGASMSIR